MDDRACSSPPPTHDRRVAVLRNGSWTEPDDGLFGPELFIGTLPACGQMDHHTITILPGPQTRQTDRHTTGPENPATRR